MLSIAFAGAVAAVAAGAAPSPPVSLNTQVSGVTYYNRPGADLSTHDADLRACVAEAAKTEQGANSGGIVGPFIVAAFNITAPGIVPNIENCMVAKRWRVVRVEQAEGARLAKLGQPALASLLKDWVGAETVHGEVARVWANDAALAQTVKYGISTPVINRSLSFAALAPTNAGPAAAQLPDRPRSARPLEPVKLESLAASRPSQAIVVVGLTGTGLYRGQGIVFQRIGSAPDAPAWVTDQQPDLFVVASPGPFAKKTGNFLVYTVPAGRWRLAGLFGAAADVIDFCLGAPSFEAGPAEVIYAGAFDFSAPKLQPDMDLGPPRALLAGQPGNAQKLKAAGYSNGSTTSCVRPISASWYDGFHFYIYDYEIDAH